MKKQELKKPFFANFLENQLTKEGSNEVQGGVTSRTEDIYQTLKYPSDSDEDTTKPALDLAHTLKYPSDNDEGGASS
ncbi:microviridin/marinostatin family tricyclic proteinase inhibitor [Flavobacterium jejuense]|uniref:Microviridin/marinostatin family tricyclic proteinase inhibitor n=1 Tax=Flavobacterium jejuense TaxID=1544455 RepID=A0ABX0IXE8_9FLAO|nr:microviridin/marinostatin family tricyclic proteinase inhibitor [Flavobacterium jejuense]NHN27925.1 microviridin/marinostatin family tricyclic proteinase inhibitor [Flavobacterium jejuense]